MSMKVGRSASVVRLCWVGDRKCIRPVKTCYFGNRQRIWRPRLNKTKKRKSGMAHFDALTIVISSRAWIGLGYSVHFRLHFKLLWANFCIWKWKILGRKSPPTIHVLLLSTLSYVVHLAFHVFPFCDERQSRWELRLNCSQLSPDNVCSLAAWHYTYMPIADCCCLYALYLLYM